MTEAQSQFGSWYAQHDGLSEYSAKAAWQHQQQRIDLLEDQLKDREGDLKFEYNRAGELEADYKKQSELVTNQGIEIMDLLDKLKIAVYALKFYTQFSDKRISENAIEALKQIEVK